MLVYLPPALVKAVKRAALEEDTSASDMVEQALEHWLTHGGRRPLTEPAERADATRNTTQRRRGGGSEGAA
jgi:hypothetical protein